MYKIFIDCLRKEKSLFFISSVFFLLPLFLFFIYAQFSPDIIYLINTNYQVSVIQNNFNPVLTKSLPATTILADLSMLKFYIVHNSSLGLYIFLAGFLFGVGSLVLLAYQGFAMGVTTGYVWQLGYGVTLWPFIIGHSVFEFLAAILSAMAGLIVGRSLLKPGQSSRLQSFVESIKKSLIYLFFAMLFYLVAAFIETFWSSNVRIHILAKYLTGATLWLLILYTIYLSFIHHESRST